MNKIDRASGGRQRGGSKKRFTSTMITTVLAVGCGALLFSGCGSRASLASIEAAAHRPIVRGSALQAGAGGASAGQASGTAGSTSGLSGASSAGGASTPGGSAAAGTPGAASGPATAAHSTGTAGAAGGSAAGAAGSTIPLGNVGTYSGVIGAVFSGAQQALQVWQAYTNAHGGLNGHPVHVFMEDDGGDPSTSASDVQQEVTQDHVIAFVGNLMPLTVSASASYLQQQNIPSIGGDASSAEWWQSPMLFPAASGLANESSFTVKAAAAAGYTKMGLLYCVEDTTCQAGEQALINQGQAKADGIDPVYTSSFSITQPDFTAQCLDAQQAGATFIYFAGDGDSLVRMANNCAAQNYHPLYEGDSIAVNAAVQNDSNLNGLIAAQSNFPWVDAFTPAQQQYQQAVKTYDANLQGSGSTTDEWASGMLAVAADKYLTGTPTSAEFLQGLWSIKNNNLGGLSPPLTFTQGQPATASDCYFLMTLKSGHFVDDDNGNTQCD